MSFKRNKKEVNTRKERGATLIEYVAIAAIMQIAILAAMPTLKSNLYSLDARSKVVATQAYPTPLVQP